MLWLSALCNFCITGLAPGFGQLIEEFDISLTQVTWLISACLLGEFMGCYSVAPFATRYGKRPLWLICGLFFLVCNIWAAVAQSFPSLLLARFFASWACMSNNALPLFFLCDKISNVRGVISRYQRAFECRNSARHLLPP